jgi:glycosyltransferase involved in cell wall biosynthesis
MQIKTSLVIPLYRSIGFLDTIIANIDAVEQEDVEIIVSDRHCYDDTIKRLSNHFADDKRIRFLQYQDKLDWVAHINSLMEESKGKYWRLMPHDDIFPAGSLQPLIKALENHSEAVLAYGPTQAIDIDGRRLRKKDIPHPHPKESRSNWQYGMVLKMFWNGYFNGAFKGLIRLDEVKKRGLIIRSTLNQIGPERCWLFALSLLGTFRFVPDSIYIKRFHQNSVHSSWEIGSDHFRSSASVMCDYLRALYEPGAALDHGIRDILSNAETLTKWMDNARGRKPSYIGEHCSDAELLANPPYRYLKRLD